MYYHSVSRYVKAKTNAAALHAVMRPISRATDQIDQAVTMHGPIAYMAPNLNNSTLENPSLAVMREILSDKISTKLRFSNVQLFKFSAIYKIVAFVVLLRHIVACNAAAHRQKLKLCRGVQGKESGSPTSTTNSA